eukprot:m.232658 g.232658  ORF g.232658 m.232658 type:complete len:50 (+) comp33626_c0_seq2:119-268(+)
MLSRGCFCPLVCSSDHEIRLVVVFDHFNIISPGFHHTISTDLKRFFNNF